MYKHVEPIRVHSKYGSRSKLPPNTIYVGVNSKFANPFKESDGYTKSQCDVFFYKMMIDGHHGGDEVLAGSIQYAEQFGIDDPETMGALMPASALFYDTIKKELKGNHLACSCKLDEPCHANTLLEIANKED